MNKFLGIGFILVLLIGVVSGVLLVQRQQQLKSRAEFICSPTDYGPIEDKTQWCACAAQNNDTGSLERENCPQANQIDPCKLDCNKCPSTTTCGNKSYVNCDFQTKCKNPGDTYSCWSTANAACRYDSYPCGSCVASSGGGSSGGGATGCSCAPTANYGDPANKTAWCACAAQCGDAGSLQQGSCPQANDPATACKLDCNKCPSTTTCGNKTYQNCDTSTCKKMGDKFKCTARENANCSYSEYPCDDTCIAANSAVGGEGLPKGSECVSYQIIDPTGADVTQSGPVYEKEKYVFKLTFKNKAAQGEAQPWTKATHKLQAMDNTAALWSTQATYPLVKDTVTKDNIEVFNIDATAGSLPAGKNFEERPFHYSMADAAGPFGALCERNVTVLKKPAGLISTKCYVIAEDATEIDAVSSCDDAKARTYSAHPTNISYQFKTPLTAATPRTLYVKFFDSSGKSSGTPFTKTIVYQPPAAISGVDCSYDNSGLATVYTIRGTSLGSQTANTKVKVGNADATVTSWNASSITARVDQRLEGSNSVSVSLDDGKKLDGSCTVGTTTATLSVKNKCATSETVNSDDVDVSIFENGPQPFVKQKVRPDKDGILQSFAPKLEKNKTYTALVRAPGTLTKKVVFTTQAATTVVEPIVLIPGDIAPKPTPDDVINSVDVSELKTQWSLVTDVSRTGDLNKDSRVNSLDYSCMKSSFNLRGDVFTPPTGTASPPSSGTSGTRVVPVSGKVFFDTNADSKFTAGETLVPNLTVKALRPAAPEVAGGTLTAAQAASATILGQTTTDANGNYSMSVTMPSATVDLVIWVDTSASTGQGGQSAVGIGQFAADFFQNRQLVMDIPLKP